MRLRKKTGEKWGGGAERVRKAGRKEVKEENNEKIRDRQTNEGEEEKNRKQENKRKKKLSRKEEREKKKVRNETDMCG